MTIQDRLGLCCKENSKPLLRFEQGIIDNFRRMKPESIACRNMYMLRRMRLLIAPVTHSSPNYER
eukprot:COSAG06_NODE_60240_length_271_cov_1.116279_1_plen_64_part_10